MQSEADASEQLDKIPTPLQQAICYTLYTTKV